MNLHLAFLNSTLLTRAKGHICFAEEDFLGSTLPPLSWAYPCGMFKKVALLHYQARQHVARGRYEGIFLGEKPTHKQMGKIGIIRREFEGKPCPFCGGHTYQLVLHAHMAPQGAGLFARCTHCQRPRALDEAFSRILWI